MKFKAEIDVMPLKELLDPQGKAVTASMKNLGLAEIGNVRIGKHISLEVEASNQEDAKVKVESFGMVFYHHLNNAFVLLYLNAR